MEDKIQQARRAAFELSMREILLGEGYCLLTVPEVMARGSDERYSSVRVRGAWEGFNAALDCVVIELPADIDQFADDDPGRRAFSLFTNAALRSCRAAIESTNLGIKIK